MKVTLIDRLVWIYMTSPCFSTIRHERPSWDIPSLKENSYMRFRQIFESLSEVGSNAVNPLRKNLVTGAAWFSIYEMAKIMYDSPTGAMGLRDGMTYELYEKMCRDSLTRPLYAKLYVRRNLLNKKVQARYIRTVQKVNAINSHYNWHYAKTKKGNPPGDEFTAVMDKCGLCTLARKLGHLDLMEPICKMEDLSASAMGITAHLEKSLGRGDDVCICHYTRPGSEAEKKWKEAHPEEKAKEETTQPEETDIND